VPVVALNTTWGPGRCSRFALDVAVLPAEDGVELLTFLENVGKRLAVAPVLIPTSDQQTMFLARHRESLGRSYRFLLAETELVERIANKRSQYEYAAEIGVPIPATWSPNRRDDLEAIAEEITFPCIVKPVYSDLWRAYRREQGFERWKKLAVVGSRSELFEAWDDMSQSGVELLLQENIAGGDDQIYNLFAYLDANSTPLAALARRKLRQWPIGHGSGCYLVSVRAPRVVEQGLTLLREMGYRGLADVEFKRDPRDGLYKLMEINVRCATHVSLAIDLGVDFPAIAYADALGHVCDPVMEYEEGRYWIDLGQDYGSFLRRESLGWGEWLRSVVRARSHAFFAVDDPKPAAARLYELLGAARDRLG
jgi:predicted ATP-grasp superfamily ATP-dependent carboligase